MSAFSVTLRLMEPEERILKCSAFRRKNKRCNQKSTTKITCEKEALHGASCLMTPRERLHAADSGDPRSFIRIYKQEATWHAGRDANGKWYFWETW